MQTPDDSTFLRTFKEDDLKHFLKICGFEVQETLPYEMPLLLWLELGLVTNIFKITHEESPQSAFDTAKELIRKYGSLKSIKIDW